MLNPGKYIHSVKIYGPTQTIGDYGVEQGQGYLGKRRAYVVPQGENETQGIEGQQISNRYTVYMRLDNCLTSDKWFDWQGKTLKILGVTHFDKIRETAVTAIEHPTRLAG